MTGNDLATAFVGEMAAIGCGLLILGGVLAARQACSLSRLRGPMTQTPATPPMRWFHVGSRDFYRFGIVYFTVALVGAISTKDWLNVMTLAGLCFFTWDSAREAASRGR
jgi:hypothetical protein